MLIHCLTSLNSGLSMIRKHSMTSALPTKAIQKMLKYHKSRPYITAWEQYEVNMETDTDEGVDIAKWGLAMTNQPENSHILIHVISDDVLPHYDDMDKKVFLLPLKLPKRIMLIENDQEVQLQPEKYYTFNDFNTHWMHNPNKSTIMLLTIGKNYDKSYSMYRRA